MSKRLIMTPQEQADYLFWSFDANHDKTEICVDEIIKVISKYSIHSDCTEDASLEY